jgi:hypothetical protein
MAARMPITAMTTSSSIRVNEKKRGRVEGILENMDNISTCVARTKKLPTPAKVSAVSNLA